MQLGYTHLHQEQQGHAISDGGGEAHMTTDLKGHELSVIVDMLGTLSIGAMKAGDDVALHQFKALCGYWKKMTAAELTSRSRKRSPRSDRDSADGVPGRVLAPRARGG
jgi:hypothetical protein